MYQTPNSFGGEEAGIPSTNLTPNTQILLILSIDVIIQFTQPDKFESISDESNTQFMHYFIIMSIIKPKNFDSHRPKTI
jgi:hypothetical protein